MKFAAVAVVAAASLQGVLATPPACLLACVAQVSKDSDSCGSNLSNIQCLCTNNASDIAQCLDDICPNGNADAAKEALESSCSEQNVKVNLAATCKCF